MDGSQIKPRFGFTGVNRWNLLAVLFFSAIAGLYFPDRLQGNYPVVILTHLFVPGHGDLIQAALVSAILIVLVTLIPSNSLILFKSQATFPAQP
jgi:hypothetical protein